MVEMETSGELSPIEKASLSVALRNLAGAELLQIMRKAETGLADSTYYQHLKKTLTTLEQKGLVLRKVTETGLIEWKVTEEITRYLTPEQLLEECLYLISRIADLENQSSRTFEEAAVLRRQLDVARIENSNLRAELAALKKERTDSLENRLINSFPALGLNPIWVEALILMALIEIMARYKLATLHQGKLEDRKFTDLLNTLRIIVPKIEGHDFNLGKESVEALYVFRNKMIHNGLIASIRQQDVEGIRTLVEDIYKQLFENR